MHLVYPPKVCITIVSNVSCVLRSSQEKVKTMVTPFLWGGGGGGGGGGEQGSLWPGLFENGNLDYCIQYPYPPEPIYLPAFDQNFQNANIYFHFENEIQRQILIDRNSSALSPVSLVKGFRHEIQCRFRNQQFHCSNLER